MTVYEITQKILTLINFQPSPIGFQSHTLALTRLPIQSRVKITPFIEYLLIFSRYSNERKNHTEKIQLIFWKVALSISG
jgi:hypothetical protein